MFRQGIPDYPQNICCILVVAQNRLLDKVWAEVVTFVSTKRFKRYSNIRCDSVYYSNDTLIIRRDTI